MSPVKVLVVDDSPTMRAIIKARLSDDPGLSVVGEAGDPYSAREAIKALSPDVITLDIEMPKMNGLEFLDKIMRLRPMPVIMISTNTQKGASMSVEALARGAVDCIGKPVSGDFEGAFADLPGKVHAAAKANVRQKSPRKVVASKNDAAYQPGDKVVFIGASTGGVDALLSVLSTFPKNCPPTLITQHMPPGFTSSFAARLNATCAPRVAEATDGAPIEPGRVYIAPGGNTHLEVEGRLHLKCRLSPGKPVSGHQPSVDVLFNSAARLRAKAVGVLLTGMGKDGADGLLAIRNAGGHTIGQDEKSSVVYGMPRVAAEMGAVRQQVSLPFIARKILTYCQAAEQSVA